MELLSSKVFELLTYIEEVEKLRRKPAYVVPTEHFVGHVGAIKGLPEVQEHLIQPDGTEVWLRIPRLQEIAPPALPDALVGWVTLAKAPAKQPLLSDARFGMDDRVQVGEQHVADFLHLKELFDRYVEHLWTPWAEIEKERRATIALYNRLFSLYQLLSVDGAENPLELIWGLGMAQWKRPGSPVIEHPLLTQLCELRLDETTYCLDIVPRQTDAKLELDCYAEMEIPGVLLLEKQWKEMQAKQAASVSPFEPGTFEPILWAAVARLDPTGHYIGCEGHYALPPASDKLLVSDRWVIYARKRSADVFLEDVRRLKAVIEGGAAIPPVVGAFVTPGDNTVPARPEVLFRGLSSSASAPGVRELYFPLPYNEEQVSIIQKLESNDGVVVQGPPGTGKTHTIANVICHYLALGKRVLVTSKGDTALAVLQEKLPERIRELSVALLADETDGMKQFEHSIGKIASQVASLRVDQLASSIAALDGQLNELHAQVAAVDQAIAANAAQHMRKYAFQDREVDPVELAQLVIDQEDDHQWFNDRLPAGSEDPPLSDDDVVRLRAARQHAAQDLASLHAKLPDPAQLPGWEALLALHKDIVKARSIEARVDSGAVLDLKDDSLETFEAANRLLVTLHEYLELHDRVARHPVGVSLRDRFRQTQPEDVLVTTLLQLGASLTKLEAARKVLLAKAPVVPEAAEANQDYAAAVERLVEGRSAFALPFGKSEARKLVATTTVEGSAPAGGAQWAVVQEVIDWRREAKRTLARYGTLAVEFGLPALPADGLEAGAKHAHDLLALAETVRAMVFDSERQVLPGALKRVFGAEVARAAAGAYEIKLPALVESLSAHLEKGRLGHALTQLAVQTAVVEGKDAAVAKQMAQFLTERIGDAAQDEAKLRSNWAALVTEAKRLSALREHFQVIGDCVQRLVAAGATGWARRIEQEPPTQDIDLAVPSLWREAWAWQVAFQLLERIDEHAQLRARFEKRRELTAKLARVYQDLVAEKAWHALCEKSSIGMRQALQGYLTSVKAMGSGTGVRALRHRKNAREAMSRAHLAVPCWVLPQWRVSETLPAELGTFDLVVIDEASQSDIWALPTLVRGKKVLVVGDHKQVSPLVVGMPEQKIVDIQNRFLGAQPHGRYMTPDASIYDLASVVFAGNSVMLKEHFRCAPAIIEYSNREFYQGEIRAAGPQGERTA